MAARIRAVAALAAALLLAAPITAQTTEDPPEAEHSDGPLLLDDGSPAYQPDLSQPPVIITQGIEAARGIGAELRGLDKVTGRTTDLRLETGEATRFGRLEVRLGECRYPSGNPSSDAYAQMTITDLIRRETVFAGWMIASSPALSALDDARYDVWVIACVIP